MDLGFAIRDVALIAAVGRTPTPRSELEQDYGRVFWLRRLLPLVATNSNSALSLGISSVCLRLFQKMRDISMGGEFSFSLCGREWGEG